MTRSKSTILGILLAGTCVLTPALAANDIVLRRFNSGAGADAVGMIDASEDTEVAGPQAIYAGEGSEVFLLDQVNGRVLSFDPKRPAAQTRAFTLPGELQPTDLVVKQGEILVWDGDIHALKPTGAADAPTRGLEEYQTRAIDDPFTVSAFSQMGSQRPGDEADLLNEGTRSLSQQQPRAPAKQYVNTRGRGPVVVNVVVEADKAGARVEVQPQNQAGAVVKLRSSFSISTSRDGCSCSAKTFRRQEAMRLPRSSRASRASANSRVSTSCRCRKASRCRDGS
jgi:hypothetical protein